MEIRQFSDSGAPFHALLDPAEYVLAQEKEHPHLGVAGRQHTASKLFGVRAVARHQPGDHQRGFGPFQKVRGADPLVERVQNQRR